MNMKKTVYLIMLAALALAVSCKKENGPMYEPTPKLPIVSSELVFSPAAAKGKVVVDTQSPITATTDRDWCAPSVSGNTVYISVTDNANKQSRYALLKLKAGDAALDLTVIQYGEIIEGLSGLSDITAPVGGDIITMPIKANVPVILETESTWIHPVFEENELVITIDTNTEPQTRFGTVTYTAGTAHGSFDVTQYPELVKVTDWTFAEQTPTYKHPVFNMDATFTAGEEDTYVTYAVPAKEVTGTVDDWIFSDLAVTARRELQEKVEATPGSTVKDFLSSGENECHFTGMSLGENYLIAVGFGENGFVSGRYQYKSVTIEDIRPTYYKWAGKWKITGRTAAYGTTTFSGEEEWTISVDENNLEKSLILKGVNSLTDATVLAAGADVLNLDYLADGSVQLKTQKSGTFDFPSLGTCSMLLAGFYTKNGTSYTVVTGTGSTLFSAALSEDGKSASITVGKRTSSGVDYDYVAFRMYLVNSAGSRYTLSVNSGAIPLAFEMTRVE